MEKRFIFKAGIDIGTIVYKKIAYSTMPGVVTRVFFSDEKSAIYEVSFASGIEEMYEKELVLCQKEIVIAEPVPGEDEEIELDLG